MGKGITKPPRLMRNFGISRLLGKRVRFLQECGPWWTSHITWGWPHTHAYKDWTQWALKRRHAVGWRMWPGVPGRSWGGPSDHNQNILWTCMKFSKNGCFQKDCVLLSLWISGSLPCRTFSRIGVYRVYGPVWMAQATGEYRAPSVASGCDHCNHSQSVISALDKLTQSLLMCRSGWLVKGRMGILEASVCWFWCYDACREAESRHLPLGIFQHTGALAFIRASFWPGLTHSPPPRPTLLLRSLPRWPFSSNCTPCEFISPCR